MTEPSAAQARTLAQHIAFGPVVFWAVHSLRELGALEWLWNNHATGVSLAELAQRLEVSEYAANVLLQAARTAGVVAEAEQRYRLTKVGYFLAHDELTSVNLDFVRDVCYPALPELTAALRKRAPSGLTSLRAGGEPGSALDGASTVYEVLTRLPAKVQSSWFAFDHFYSDQAFELAIPLVLSRNPNRLMDVGANTGRFLRRCLQAAPNLRALAVDHAGQLELLESELPSSLRSRVETAERDLTRPGLELPGPCDAIWLSQVLDCLEPRAAVSVLSAARRALAPNGWLYVLEPCIDLQRHPAAEFCLTQTSLYFACVANGTSQMYSSRALHEFLESAGLVCRNRIDGLGVGHSLFECQAAETVRQPASGDAGSPP